MSAEEVIKKHEEIKAVVFSAASFIKDHFNDQDISPETKENKNSLVSYVDVGAERILVEGLSALFPDFGFVTEEETTEQQTDRDFYWIIDPLDGTTNFLHGLPEFSVSVALSDRHHDLKWGMVIDVMRDTVYHAAAGEGAYKNGIQLQLEEVPLEEALISTGFPYYTFENKDRYLEDLSSFMELSRGIRRCGSAAMDLVRTAEGVYGGFFEYDLHIWDIAAGALIVEEAGGHVTDFEGNPDAWKESGNVVAGDPMCHQQMFELVFYQNSNK